MILSKPEKALLEMLEQVDGPMPLDWIKPHYRSAIPRLRNLGMIHKRPVDWVRLTKMGHGAAVESPPRPDRKQP